MVVIVVIVVIVEQPGAKLDLRDIMDEGKILIVNLSKGRVGKDNAALLDAFFVNGMQQAAMSRADISSRWNATATG